jgi:peptidoglycan/LPS O-acetylase OafA/YrhL
MTHLPVDIVYFHGLDLVLPGAASATPLLVWSGVFVACIAVSILVHEAIEKPARRWLRQHDPFLRRPPAEPRDEPVI